MSFFQYLVLLHIRANRLIKIYIYVTNAMQSHLYLTMTVPHADQQGMSNINPNTPNSYLICKWR